MEPACGAALSAVYSSAGLLKRLAEENRIDVSSGPAVIVVCGGVSVQMLL